MKPNRLKEIWSRGEIAFGTWVTIGNPDVSEILSHLGFDWLVFDTEHAPLSMETVQHMIQATSGTNIVPLIRVAWNDMVLIKLALDVGAYGVVVPWVNNRDDAIKAVKATRYPPKGLRGTGPRRAALYGLDREDYFRRVEDELVTIVQTETPEAIKNIDEIMTVEGVSACFIGPTDLTTSLGIRDQQDHPKFIEAIERVLDAGRRYKIPVGIMTYNDEQLRKAIERGFKFISLSSDFSLLIRGARSFLEVAKKSIQPKV
ncbi:MAG: aldolase/citrate lyase family protein [Nitrososphaerota archaeon]|nr:aldolase/citrate lyase family protein [Nitrososphaerales archaeon]MDW8045028.1 aldolase/citrate lyase family protein [Nitrososphaerota archaeon]